MADGLVPRIIVLALGAGVLGFPDVLRVLLDIAGRSPLTDMAICVLAVAVVTAQALGAMLLARFVRKARAGGDAHAAGARPLTRTDRFAQVTLVVSLGVAFLVSACLLGASGAAAGSLALLQAVADVAREMRSPVVAVLATAAAVLPCARTLLRVFRQEEDHSHGAAAASSSTRTGRFASMTTQVANFTGAAAFLLLLVVSGGLYIQPGSLVSVSIGAAAIVGTMLLALFTRKARNAAGAGGRAAPASTSDTRRVGGNGKLTRLPPYLAVVAFALLCCLVLTTTESGPDGAKYP